MAHAWDLYAKGLMPLGYGHPLWGPEPDPTYGEVRLGDVGYIQDGHFCFLFNAMHGPSDPINQDGVPDQFEVFTPPTSTTIHRPDVITQSQLHSRSLQSIAISTTTSASELGVAATAGLRFQCNEETGALLMLKQPAHKTYLNCAVHIRRYIRNHLSSWCDFANQVRGIGLQEKDIIFISGHTKTSVWAEAAFHHTNSNGELVIGGSCFVPSVSGDFRVSMSRCTDATVFSRYGPRELVSSWSENLMALPCMPKCQQSIFVNYYKMKTRRWPLRDTVIRAAAGPHELPDDDEDGDPSAGAQSWRPVVSSDDDFEAFDETYDPVEYLLDYILKHSDAQVACADDDDLARLFMDRAFPEDLGNALETLAPRVLVDEHGVGTVTNELHFDCSSADPEPTSPSLVSSISPSSHGLPIRTDTPLPSAIPLGSPHTTDISRPRRKGGYGSRSSRHALTIAVELAREAVRLDLLDIEPLSAMMAYSQCVSYLDQALQGTAQENNERDTSRDQDVSRESKVQRLRSVRDTYVARINHLSLIYPIPLPSSEPDLVSENRNLPLTPSNSSVRAGSPRREPSSLAIRDPLPVGGQFPSIFDSCHSGSFLDPDPDPDPIPILPLPLDLVPDDNGQDQPLGKELEDDESDEKIPDDAMRVKRRLSRPNDKRQHSSRGLLTHELPAIATSTLTRTYNLSDPSLPMMPRTTRQKLNTELSESLQRNLKWERQVSRTNLIAQRAGISVLFSGVQPPTEMIVAEPAVVRQQSDTVQSPGRQLRMEIRSGSNPSWIRRDISNLSRSHLWSSKHNTMRPAGTTITMDQTSDPSIATSLFLGDDWLGSTILNDLLVCANNLSALLPGRRAFGSTGEPEHDTHRDHTRPVQTSFNFDAPVGSPYLGHAFEGRLQSALRSVLWRLRQCTRIVTVVNDQTLTSTSYIILARVWDEDDMCIPPFDIPRGLSVASRRVPKRRPTDTARKEWVWADTMILHSPSSETLSAVLWSMLGLPSNWPNTLDLPGDIGLLQDARSDTESSARSSITRSSYNTGDTTSAATNILTTHRQPDEEARQEGTHGELGNRMSATGRLTSGNSSSSLRLGNSYSPARPFEHDFRDSTSLTASVSRRLSPGAPLHEVTSPYRHPRYDPRALGTAHIVAYSYESSVSGSTPTRDKVMDDFDKQAQTSPRTSSLQQQTPPTTYPLVLTCDSEVTSPHFPSSTLTELISRRLTLPANETGLQAGQVSSDTSNENEQSRLGTRSNMSESSLSQSNTHTTANYRDRG